MEDFVSALLRHGVNVFETKKEANTLTSIPSLMNVKKDKLLINCYFVYILCSPCFTSFLATLREGVHVNLSH